jgi:pyruvate dehydrogenase E1 component alpha subunit
MAKKATRKAAKKKTAKAAARKPVRAKAAVKAKPKAKPKAVAKVKPAPSRRSAVSAFPLGKAGLLQAYRTMRTIREFEETLHAEFAKGEIPGFVHLYAGEEAAGTAIMMHLADKDRVASTHRGHGHCIAKGVEVKAMMAEIFGKAAGLCKGKGGSMHVADLSKGMMGANGILGAGAPLICGAALAAKYRGDGAVGISFVGDGASNQGTFLESLNLAAVWNLPAIFVVENNGYAESTSRDYAVAVDSYVDRAAGFGLPGVTVDGTDFFAVYEAAGEIIRRAREGGGPALLECKMVRFYGHFEGDQQLYRGKGELDDIRANKDCIKLFAERVVEAGAVSRAELEAIDKDAIATVAEALAFAKSTPAPSPSDLTTDVYVKY